MRTLSERERESVCVCVCVCVCAPLPVEHLAEGQHVSVGDDDGDAARLERVEQRRLAEPCAADHEAELGALQ